jgi:sigma-B regulation protein RsbU (phosphoserine phosphatase)
MASVLYSTESKIYRIFHRQPPRGRLHRVGFALLVICLVLFVVSFLPGSIGTFGRDFRVWALLSLVVVYLWIAGRWLFRHLLWKVRNRLVVTYLLMALAPIVLVAVLGLASAYVFSGEFAIFAVTSEIQSELARLGSQNRAFAVHVGHALEDKPKSKSVPLPELDAKEKADQVPGFEVVAFMNGKPVPLERVPTSTTHLELPGWTADGFRGIVIDEEKLYLRAFDIHTSGLQQTMVITSLPLSKQSANQIAKGLGRVEILPSFFGAGEGTDAGASRSGPRQDLRMAAENPSSVVGGQMPLKEHFYDLPIRFGAPMSISDWKTGKPRLVLIDVESEPSLLYRRLVIASLQSQSFFQNALIGLAAFFAVLELIAFIMAVRLSRTITQSVHDIYEATGEVDRGNFSHRIPVRRNDQLAALSSSFNSMTASLEGLLEEQREKERLQNELDIAQEVQANLFPRDDISLPHLELHGVCRPARTVSGDYYDFLLFGKGGLGLALGDISGKGISAALLMATLHSAVRAYRFAGEELIYEGNRALHLPMASSVDKVKGSEEIDCGEWFESPGKILALLNRHLYRSTQPEKYATLFLGHYQSENSRLTYSNGGQLPPLLLRSDNSVVRLDCGGTVVGLIDGMSYEQASVQMKRGDILVAYSDGVTEPENDFGDFGEDRLIEIVRRNRFLPLPVICELVLQALRDWIGAQEQPDDITLVLARQT